MVVLVEVPLHQVLFRFHTQLLPQLLLLHPLLLPLAVIVVVGAALAVVVVEKTPVVLTL